MTEKKVHWKTAQKLAQKSEPVETVIAEPKAPAVVKPTQHKVSRPFLVYDKDEGLRCQLRTEQEAIEAVRNYQGGFYINVN